MNLSKIESPNWMAPEGDYFLFILINFKSSVIRLEVDWNKINIHEIWFGVWGWGGWHAKLLVVGLHL